MYATHKQMPALIRKAKKVVVYTRLGSDTATSLIVEKGSILEFYTMIAKENKEWPESFSYTISDNGWLYINGDAFKETSKRLGIKHSNAAIQEYLNA